MKQLFFLLILLCSFKSFTTELVENFNDKINTQRQQMPLSQSHQEYAQKASHILTGYATNVKLENRAPDQTELETVMRSVTLQAIGDAFDGKNNWTLNNRYMCPDRYANEESHLAHIMVLKHMYGWARFCIDTLRQTTQVLPKTLIDINWGHYTLWAMNSFQTKNDLHNKIFHGYLVNHKLVQWLKSDRFSKIFNSLQDKIYKDITYHQPKAKEAPVFPQNPWMPHTETFKDFIVKAVTSKPQGFKELIDSMKYRVDSQSFASRPGTDYMPEVVPLIYWSILSHKDHNLYEQKVKILLKQIDDHDPTFSHFVAINSAVAKGSYRIVEKASFENRSPRSLEKTGTKVASSLSPDFAYDYDIEIAYIFSSQAVIYSQANFSWLQWDLMQRCLKELGLNSSELGFVVKRRSM